jgi:hypothetical protein
MSYCRKSHGGDAAALGAVWIAAELAWGDDCLEVGGYGVGGASEDAIRRRLRGIQKLQQGGLVHVEDGIEGAKAKEFCDDGCTDGGGQDLRTRCSPLWREYAHPNLLCFGTFGPELKKPLEISGLVCDLAGNGAVDRNARLREVLQYTLVGCRCATYIVFGLQTVDGDDDVEAFKCCPMGGDGTEGAGNDLSMDAAAVELGKDRFELTEADEGVSANEGDVERLVLVDYAEDVRDQGVVLVIG